MKRLVWYTATVLATLTILVLLWQFRQALVLFLLSLATAAAFRPLIEFFTRRKIPRSIALFLSYFLVVGLILLLLFLVSGPLIRELERASNNFSLFYERIMVSWPETGTALQRTLAEQLPPPEELYTGLSGAQGTAALQALLGVTASVSSFFGNLGIILILSLYWSADNIRFERLWLSLIPVEQRTRAREIWRSIEQSMGAYIRSEVVQSLLAGVLLWLGYQLIGLRYPALLSLTGALAWLVPWFGAVIAIIPPLLVGLDSSLLMGIAAAVYTLAVLVIMELFIEPRFFPRQRYSSVILVLVVLALTDAFGLIGLLLSPLLAAAIQISFRYLSQPPVPARPTEEEEIVESEREIYTLQERLERAKEILEKEVEAPAPELVSLMDRLNRLVTETNDYLRVSSNSK
jgi:predicted PurR-regulated permease PerM